MSSPMTERMRHALIVAVMLAPFSLFGLAACGNTQPPPLASVEGQVRVDQPGDGVNPYTLTVTHVNVDGRSIACVVLDNGALSCDWGAK